MMIDNQTVSILSNRNDDMTQTIPFSEFKSTCLKIIDQNATEVDSIFDLPVAMK